jgi:hypothetical protein
VLGIPDQVRSALLNIFETELWQDIAVGPVGEEFDSVLRLAKWLGRDWDLLAELYAQGVCLFAVYVSVDVEQ